MPTVRKVAVLLASALLLVAPRAPLRDAPHEAAFSAFRYSGADPADFLRLPPGSYRNPVLAGFRPDPSVVRVGADFYLMTSSFAYWPGLPVFHSRDLVSWRQVGAAITRRGQMDLAGVFPSHGLYAPDLKHHRGLFYALSTCVGCGGNFAVTARDPRGPWSNPAWLPFDGIDPSIFFDVDGRAYVLNDGPPDGAPRWPGHRAIWMQEIDLATLRMTGPRTIIVDGGADPASRPEWIEGPHLFRKDGWYHLIAAEGGTGERHAEVAFRSRTLRGPYAADPSNPILTQRDLPDQRPFPIAAAGHADMVELANGSWWTVFLGTRPYAPGTYNTGRDTFLLPVAWRHGWPTMLDRQRAVPRVTRRPALPPEPPPKTPVAGAFSFADRFTSACLAPTWTFLRTPRERWWRTGGGELLLRPRPDALGSLEHPSLLAVRQSHANARAEVTLRFQPKGPEEAGLVAFMDERRFLAAALGVASSGGVELHLRRRLDNSEAPDGVIISAVALPNGFGPVRLQLRASGPRFRFRYAPLHGPWRPLGPDLDATLLSTRVAGGFTGTMIGLFASGRGRAAP